MTVSIEFKNLQKICPYNRYTCENNDLGWLSEVECDYVNCPLIEPIRGKEQGNEMSV